MKLNISEVIDTASSQSLSFQPGEVQVIQTTHEYLKRIEHLTRVAQVFQLVNRPTFYKRLTVHEQLKFFKRWYNYTHSTNDLLKQFLLEADSHVKLKQLSSELTQRTAFTQAIMSDQPHVIVLLAFSDMSTQNIHLFHKMIAQLKEAGKSLLVVTTRLEDAFIIQPNIMTLNQQGLTNIVTETEELGNQTVSNLKVKVDDKTIFVSIEDIEYIESNEGKTFINIDRQRFALDSTLSAAVDALEGHGFYRCHRSYIINLHKVQEIITWSKNSYSIVISNLDQTKIPLSCVKFTEIQSLLVIL